MFSLIIIAIFCVYLIDDRLIGVDNCDVDGSVLQRFLAGLLSSDMIVIIKS